MYANKVGSGKTHAMESKSGTLVFLLLMLSCLFSESKSAGVLNRESSDEIDTSSGGSVEVPVYNDESTIGQPSAYEFEKMPSKSTKPLVLLLNDPLFRSTHPGRTFFNNILPHHFNIFGTMGKALATDRDNKDDGKMYKEPMNNDEYWDSGFDGPHQQQMDIGKYEIPTFTRPFYGRPTYGQLAHYSFTSGGKEFMEPTALRSSNAKRSPSCMRKCIQQGYLHPAQCHSMC